MLYSVTAPWANISQQKDLDKEANQYSALKMQFPKMIYFERER